MAKVSRTNVGKDSPGNAPLRFTRRNDKPGTEADWTAVTATLLKDVIVSACIVGGAIRFGSSRDKGAYCIGIYVDGKSHSEWLPCNQSIDELLEDIIDYFREIDALISSQEAKDARSE